MSDNYPAFSFPPLIRRRACKTFCCVSISTTLAFGVGLLRNNQNSTLKKEHVSTFSRCTENSGPPFNRRTLLKSAGMAAGIKVIGSTVLANASSGIHTESGAGEQSKRETSMGSSRENGSLRKGLVGFQLGYEQFRVDELVELGVLVEQAGFDVITNSDHLQPWQSNEGHSGQPWLTMAAITARTKKIWMGTTVTCPTFRYSPAVVAEAFASLNILYPGRIFLGVGSGEALNEQAATGTWPKWPERSERLVEATEIIRKLWAGQQVQHQGKYYNVNMRLYDTPKTRIPLLMAGNGPKAMRRVGRHADGLITDPKTWKEHREEFESGAREAKKDPSQMPIFIEQFVVVGDKKDAETSAELWRFLPKAWKPYFNIRDPQEIQRRAEAELPLKEVYKDFTVSTDPEVHVKALQEAFKGGATEVHIHSGQADQRRVIEFYGKEVLPRLRKGQMGKAA
jgi:F420-dependent hydroxymycolic acid dehydrogenase